MMSESGGKKVVGGTGGSGTHAALHITQLRSAATTCGQSLPLSSFSPVDGGLHKPHGGPETEFCCRSFHLGTLCTLFDLRLQIPGVACGECYIVRVPVLLDGDRSVAGEGRLNDRVVGRSACALGLRELHGWWRPQRSVAATLD
jgi:hypothetical protein